MATMKKPMVKKAVKAAKMPKAMMSTTAPIKGAKMPSKTPKMMFGKVSKK